MDAYIVEVYKAQLEILNQLVILTQSEGKSETIHMKIILKTSVRVAIVNL